MITTLLFLIIGLLVILQLGLQIFATVDLIQSRPHRDQNEFFLWLLVIWLISTIGAIIYFVAGRIQHEKPTSSSEEDWS